MRRFNTSQALNRKVKSGVYRSRGGIKGYWKVVGKRNTHLSMNSRYCTAYCCIHLSIHVCKSSKSATPYRNWYE